MCQTLQQFECQLKKKVQISQVKSQIHCDDPWPLTWTSLAVMPPIFNTIPDLKQVTEGSGETAGQDIIMGVPDRCNGNT